MPLPNIAGGGQNNFFYVQRNTNEAELYDFRIDHNFNDNHRIFGRFSYRTEDDLKGAPNSLPYPARASSVSAFRTKQFALNYNATLTATMHNEFRGGFSLFPASRTDERTEGIVGGAGPLSPYTKDLFRNRGPGGLSRDFAYNLSVIYELPAGPGRGRFESGPASWILGGWQVGGILSLQSGPWGTHIWNPNLQNAGGADRGDLVGYPNLPESQRDSMVWWDRSAIAAGTPGQWHNAGRGLVELPGWKNMDLLLSKYFQMPWEGHRLQFRFEAFNLTNTPHLGGPGNNNPVRNINANSSAAARIFLADQPRIIQFALKYTF